MTRTRLNRRTQPVQSGIHLKYIFFSSLKALFLSVICIILYTFLLTYSPLPEQSMPYVTLGIGLALSLWAGFRVAKRVRHMGWLHGMLTGGCYGCILLLISMMIVSGPFSFSLLLRYLPFVLASMIGGIIGVK